MKKQILLALVIVVTAIGLFAQTAQRGPRREKIRQARQGKAEGNNENNAKPNNNGSYVVGKNRFTTQVNGDTREYYVHVPQSYNKATATPVVFMLHGTSGDGLKFYNISGWKEVGETENIITVYPSSWHYCITEEGKRLNTTKWHVLPGGGFTPCAGEVPRDDVKFVNQVIDELQQKFSINQKMIYMAGFSNGGQMTARVGVEMSKRVAAVVSSAGRLTAESPLTPQRLLPNLLQIGTDDPHITPLFGGHPAPMNFDQFFQAPGTKAMMEAYIKTYKLNPKYMTGGDPNNILWLEAKGTSGNPNNVFRFALMKGVEHEYPNGKNHPVHGAELNWQWLKQFKLP